MVDGDERRSDPRGDAHPVVTVVETEQFPLLVLPEMQGR